MYPIVRTISVSVPVPVGTKKGAVIQLPDKAELRNPGTLVTGLELVNDSVQSFDANGRPVITATESLSVSVTLIQGSVERHKQIPFNLYNPVSLYGLYKSFKPFAIDTQRSFVVFGADTTAAADFVIPFVFHYVNPADLK